MMKIGQGNDNTWWVEATDCFGYADKQRAKGRRAGTITGLILGSVLTAGVIAADKAGVFQKAYDKITGKDKVNDLFEDDLED